MGLLDQKERVLDIVLTSKGREYMSRNQLDFKYYAFSDEGVNYSASFSTGTLDDYLHKNIPFEADQRINTKGFFDGVDLQTFLYTFPPGNKYLIPEFVTNLDSSQPISISRQYILENFAFHTKKRNRIIKPIATIMRATIPRSTIQSRISDYVYKQKAFIAQSRLAEGKSIVGMPVGKNYVALDNKRVINIKDGSITPLSSELLKIPTKTTELVEEIEVSKIEEYLEKIVGIDRQKIEFRLKTSEGEIQVKNGFLIELFDSGSDGRLIKIISEDVDNPINDETVEEGFSSFLKLGIDE